MTGEIERRREPVPGRHIELSAAASPELRDRHHRPFKRRRIERQAIPHPSEVGQVVDGRPEPRELARQCIRAAENEDGGGGGRRVALPVEEGEEEEDPEDGEGGLVSGEEGDGGGNPGAVGVCGGFQHWNVWGNGGWKAELCI